MRVEYSRVEPPGIPAAFWRSVGPLHNIFVTESWRNWRLRRSRIPSHSDGICSASRPANTVLELAAEKGGWGLPLPQGFGRGVALQFVFATYMAQIAEVEVSRDGSVRIRRVVCAVDCGISVNPDTVGGAASKRHVRRHRLALWRDHPEGWLRPANRLR